MNSIDDYIDSALEKIGSKSDRELCRRLNLSLMQVCYWRNRKSLPTDETMAKLASLSGKNVEFALINLNWWRAVSRNEHIAADHYFHMIESYQNEAA